PQSIPAIHILGPLEKSVDATKTKTLVVDAEGNRDLEKVDIRLRVIDSRVVFDINLKSMDAKGATISSKILKLAKETIAAPRGSP
ncbi:MAG: DUF4154 domain-containing protein, partial [Bdellovibrionales bacterium]|nr:DUF4154 domain-containing protein [Bdellovibrionales bacterium]